jgi:hypothetical protein
MHTAPDKMISSAQTVAKTGRWIKKSTNKMSLPFQVVETAGQPGRPPRSICL